MASSTLHSALDLQENHAPHSFEYANEAARTGASGLTAEDVGKWALQLDNGLYYRLTNHSPVTWTQVTGAADLSDAVILAPDTSTRNMIEGTGDVTLLTLKGNEHQSEPLLLLTDADDNGLFSFLPGGHLEVAREVRFLEAGSGGSHVAFVGPDELSGDLTWKLPEDEPAADDRALSWSTGGQLVWTHYEPYLGVPDGNAWVLSSDQSGNRSWVDPATFGGGSSGGGDLLDAVILDPDSLNRNLVQPTGNYHALVLQAHATLQTEPVFEMRGSGGDEQIAFNNSASRQRVSLTAVSGQSAALVAGHAPSATDRFQLWATTPTNAPSTTLAGLLFSGTYPMGLVQVDNQLINLGINVPAIGTRNDANIGGIFRFDTRSGRPLFSVIRYAPGGSSTALWDFRITSGGRAIFAPGAAEGDTATGTVDVRVATSTVPGLYVKGAANQSVPLHILEQGSSQSGNYLDCRTAGAASPTTWINNQGIVLGPGVTITGAGSLLGNDTGHSIQPSPTSGVNSGFLSLKVAEHVDAIRKGVMIPMAPHATANYALFSIGGQPWDGTTAGFFAGSSSGTVFGTNHAASFGGNFIDLQRAGVRSFRVGAAGNVGLAGALIVGGTGMPTTTVSLDLLATDQALRLNRVPGVWSAPLDALLAVDTTDGRLKYAFGLNWQTLALTTEVTTAHGALSGLAGDAHADMAFLNGRNGGQTWIAGTLAGDVMTLIPTSHPSGGFLDMGLMRLDTMNSRIGFKNPGPQYDFDFGPGTFRIQGLPSGNVVSNAGVLEIGAGGSGSSPFTRDDTDDYIFPTTLNDAFLIGDRETDTVDPQLANLFSIQLASTYNAKNALYVAKGTGVYMQIAGDGNIGFGIAGEAGASPKNIRINGMPLKLINFSGSHHFEVSSNTTEIDTGTVEGVIPVKVGAETLYLPLFAATAPTEFFEDLFTGTGAFGNTTSGHAWIIRNGTWARTSDQGQCTGTAGDMTAVVNASQANVRVRVTLSAIGSGSRFGLCIRNSSSADFICLSVQADNNQFRILKFETGQGLVQIGSTYSATPQAGDVVELEGNGTTIKAYVNSVERISGTSSFNQSVTNHGLYITSNLGSSSDCRWDGLVCEAPS